MQYITLNFTSSTRRERHNGREYLVAPLTLIVPGVLAGSQGPLYYPPEEVANSAEQWDGVPITVDHPFLNGQVCSASNAGVLDRQGIGVVRKPSFRDGKLVAEGWFDIERTRRVDHRVYDALKAGRPMEVSTGLSTENEPKRGTYNGRCYDAIARRYEPDHLAVLPDRIGACSLRDGCGLNVNQDGEPIMNGDNDLLPLPGPVVPERRLFRQHSNPDLLMPPSLGDLLAEEQRQRQQQQLRQPCQPCPDEDDDILLPPTRSY